MTRHDELKIEAEIIERAKKIKLLLMDCDGVLTNGRLYLSENGEALKVFHVRDGQGLATWHKAGFRSGIISGRDAEKILQRRVEEIGMHYLKTRSSDKAKDLAEILEDASVAFDEVAYIGDDIGDICLLEKVGLPVAVADAAAEVFPFVKYTTKLNGGCGAVREVTDLLLRAKKQSI
ncbi:MAG: KdsC family phosphatase [Pyrinomonadaceae bacterium]